MNDEFGDAQNNPANFTEYSAAKNGKTLSEEVKKNEKLLNAMYQMQQPQSTVAAKILVIAICVRMLKNSHRCSFYPISRKIAVRYFARNDIFTIFAAK